MRKKFWKRMMLWEHHFKYFVDPDDRGWYWLDYLNGWIGDRWYDAAIREDKKVKI